MENKRKIILLSFGNIYYYNSLKKLNEEAKLFNFDKIIIYTEHNLINDNDFWNKHGEFIKRNNKGFGFWLWKSYCVKKVLETLNDNDILFYCDAGCSLNIQGKQRFDEYIKMLDNEKVFNILSFQLPHLEKEYTKMDLIKFFNAYDYINSGQYVGGIFFIKKNIKSCHTIDLWYKIASYYHFLDDSPSEVPNDINFKGHRHDQSIFSLLRKQIGSIVIPDETYSAPNWDKTLPIWAMRRKL